MTAAWRTIYDALLLQSGCDGLGLIWFLSNSGLGLVRFWCGGVVLSLGALKALQDHGVEVTLAPLFVQGD